ncbi:hypothetical protein [Streptomyces sp. NPDC004533]|uniref:hypothetical protein n=1 Tax=unclassified Streptomyces TaxID=2593676 RepID=UPI0033B4C2BC
MKRKPPIPGTATPPDIRTRGTRVYRWARQRRRDAATYLLRGACYGFGTGVVGLGFWWLEQHM